MWRRLTLVLIGVALVASACSDDDGSARADDAPEPTSTSAPPERPPSLTRGGERLAEGRLADAPRYNLKAHIDPRTGAVRGHERVTIPEPGTGELRFRVFPNLPQLDAGFTVTDVTVDGVAVEPQLDQGLMTLPRPDPATDAPVVVELSFAYTAPPLDQRRGLPLQAATIGLISRQPSGIALGHWFPIWVPDGLTVDPNPEGFGDISAFPAAVFNARLSVPRGTELVSGGVTVEAQERPARTAFIEEGTGLRDLAVFAGADLDIAEVEVGDVTVRAIGADVGRLEPAAEIGASAIETFTDLFGPYPWTEYDLVLNDLGFSVGGAEWPGMAWIAVDGSSVIVHEAAHEWWHALVGNDSTQAPAVDEPLAVYSECLWAQTADPDQGRNCVGTDDPPTVTIDRPTADFTSPGEYGELIYRELPGFYAALADMVGEDVVIDALRAIATEHAFGVITTDDLRAGLAAEAPPDQQEAVIALFDAWFHAGTTTV